MTGDLADREAAFREAMKGLQQSLPAGAQPWDRDLILVLSFGMLAFGLVVVGLMTWLLIKKRTSPLMLPGFGLTLIVVAAVVLVIVGFDDKQISPVVGLLGTLAGYLLGRESSNPSTTAPLSSPAADPP